MVKKEKWVTICPKCGSTDVSPESNPAYIDSGLSTSYKQCENCGHHGLVFPKVPKSKVPKKTKPLSKVKNPTMVQTGYGEGYFKYLIYVSIPIMIFAYLAIFSSGYSGNNLYLAAPLTISLTLLILILGTYYLFRRQK